MGVQASAKGSYRAPVLRNPVFPPSPPHTIISLPVHTDVWRYRGEGAPAVEVAVQASVNGSYRPPVSRSNNPYVPPNPPHTTIRLPVQTAVWAPRRTGAPSSEVGVHLSETGSYRPPEFTGRPSSPTPPHTIITFPVQTAVCPDRGVGALPVYVGDQVSVAGS